MRLPISARMARIPRWSWSARSPDGANVVLTLWQHEFSTINGVTTYTPRSRDDIDWSDRHGNLERVENLKWALAHCDGKVRVVIAVADDANAKCGKSNVAFRIRNW
jgi:hypothetical protein